MQDATKLRVMGWLRDLMNTADPPVRSFGKLASACLEHSEWPQEADIKPRSLATLLSKLDREQDLDWLRDRPEIQLVVARVLGRPLGDVRAALGEPDTPPGGRMLRLRDARYARELDLSREDLPPGIPVVTFSPPQWERLIWRAPPGSGRTLVGLWLEARGLAQFVTVRCREDLQRIPRRGTIFVEVTRRVSLTSDDLDALHPERRPVCVALEQPPHVASWTTVSSPPVEHYLSELIDWLSSRLDDSGEFSPERAEQWMRRVALPHGACRTWGDALGLLGMLDELKPRSLHGKSLDELAESFVKRQVKEATLNTSWGPRVADAVFPALRHMAARCLVTEGADLDHPRTIDEWTELLTTDSEVAPDEEWFVRALVGGTSLNQRELKRAARKLPPGGYQIARSLLLAHLLVRPTDRHHPLEDELTVLSPRWLVSVLLARSASDALELSPADWGAALLDPQRTPTIEEALTRRLFASHFAPVESVLEGFDEGDPGLAAALDACLRATARVQLFDGSVPEELVQGLLELASENLIVLGDQVVPTLTADTVTGWQAAIAVLSRENGFPLARLDPHRAATGEIRVRFAEACAHEATRSNELGLLQLADELTPRGSPERPQILRTADLLSQSAHLETVRLDPEDWARRFPLDLSLRFAQTLVGDAASQHLWQLVPPEQVTSSLSDPELLRQLWMRCPTKTLLERQQLGCPIAWQHLLPHHFGALLESGPPLSKAAALHCPLEAAADALKTHGPIRFSPEALRELFLRAPTRLMPLVVQLLGRLTVPQATNMLAAIPPEAASQFVAALPPTPELLMWPSERLELVQMFLSRAILQRAPGYRECFQRQNELKIALRPLLH